MKKAFLYFSLWPLKVSFYFYVKQYYVNIIIIMLNKQYKIFFVIFNVNYNICIYLSKSIFMINIHIFNFESLSQLSDNEGLH